MASLESWYYEKGWHYEEFNKDDDDLFALRGYIREALKNKGG